MDHPFDEPELAGQMIPIGPLLRDNTAPLP